MTVLALRCGLALQRFLLTPASARPLGALRIALGSLLMAQAVFLRHDILNLFSRHGWVQGNLTDYLNQFEWPQITFLMDVLARYGGLSEDRSLFMICQFYFCSLVFLTAGLWTRAAAFVAFSMQWMLTNSGHCSPYGFDTYAHIFLFYLMWVPAGDAMSLDAAMGAGSPSPSSHARLGLRVMQIHLAIAYLASGIEKATGPQWWNGELIWQVLSLPEYRQFEMSWLADWPLLPILAGWATLIAETFFCVAIWNQRTRPAWVAIMVSMHMGIAVFLGLHMFGLQMCCLLIALFGVSPAPVNADEPIVSRTPRAMSVCETV